MILMMMMIMIIIIIIIILIPWKGGKSMTWDATVTDTVAESYISITAVEAGAAAEAAAGRKEAK